jgi:hypothetical protein
MAIIKGKKIIACTTNGAAKYTRAIQSASPGVVLVEEVIEFVPEIRYDKFVYAITRMYSHALEQTSIQAGRMETTCAALLPLCYWNTILELQTYPAMPIPLQQRFVPLQGSHAAVVGFRGDGRIC